MNSKYIYSDIIPDLLTSIYDALRDCIGIGLQSERLNEANPALTEHFKKIRKQNIDKHITTGLFVTHQERSEIYPRLLKLTINAFKDANEINVRDGYIIPSPLHILYYSLISPEHAQTAAYSLASCRTFLMETLSLNNSTNRKYLESITEQDISESMDSFTRHINIQLRWPKEYGSSIKSMSNLLVGHFLAMKSIAHLWFRTKKEAVDFLNYKRSENLIEFIVLKLSTCRFRLSNKYNELPESGEIINQLFGIPFPIKGAETVFFGGLKPASFGGLIISASGQPGIGKTSFALSLANSLSPLGIKCFYLSLEEEEGDLRNRLKTLQPPYQKEFSIFRSVEENFFVDTLTQALKFEDFIKLIKKINKRIETNKKKELNSSNSLTSCDSLIVIDNLNEFFKEEKYELIESLIKELRKLKSLVVIISGEGILENFKMEYLIDVGIKLHHDGIDKMGEKPIRLFNLFKTRHQLSRQGTHVFHMSGDDGFRISPQIPSQMDRKEKVKRYLHDDSKVIDVLNYIDDDKKDTVKSSMKVLYKKIKGSEIENRSSVQNKRFLFLFPQTHILVHGYGSAGKAGFALKILLTPTINSNLPLLKKVENIESSIYRRKVLILSFLYPKKYYDELIEGKGSGKSRKESLLEKINNVYSGLKKPMIHYLIFHPGYLSPEDFVVKITRTLDMAILHGEPFTGVLIDGLHNVFLQFPKLQKYDMVWPLLYNILSRYKLTVVSTFTNFALNDRLLDDNPNEKNQIINQALPDHLLMQQGMAPFLHALVKASDFYLFLEQIVVKGERKYILSVKGAIGQEVPTELLEWDRQKNVFRDIYPYSEVLKDEMEKNIESDKIIKVKIIE